MDKELTKIRVRMYQLALRMQHNVKTHWVYEWPLRRKAKWPVKKLLAKRQRRLLIGWLRHDEHLRDEQGMVHACEPESGSNLNDDEEKERLSRDLRNCQVVSEEFSVFQVGNKKRSQDDLKDCSRAKQKI
jgi:hypothetical protein